jgi:hypothetical protein
MMAEADAGSNEASDALRILTPLIKFRACRDNISVATGAMEVRGGNGYIEEWVNARLVRDAHIGVLWEGTSNINALDVIGRAVGRAGVHKALASVLENKLEHAPGLPSSFRAKLQTTLHRAIALAESVATERDQEEQSRRAASALYHAASAILLAHEGALNYTDGRRALLSRMVLDHRLSPDDPLAVHDTRHEPGMMAALLSNQPVSIQRYSDNLTA